MKRHRHTPQDIAAKVQQADDMARDGKSQPEIARALGVSIMTLHRWRKAEPAPERRSRAPERARPPEGTANEMTRRIQELELENSRLRRLVADFLLEKMRLEDELSGRK